MVGCDCILHLTADNDDNANRDESLINSSQMPRISEARTGMRMTPANDPWRRERVRLECVRAASGLRLSLFFII